MCAAAVGHGGPDLRLQSSEGYQLYVSDAPGAWEPAAVVRGAVGKSSVGVSRAADGCCGGDERADPFHGAEETPGVLGIKKFCV